MLRFKRCTVALAVSGLVAAVAAVAAFAFDYNGRNLRDPMVRWTAASTNIPVEEPPMFVAATGHAETNAMTRNVTNDLAAAGLTKCTWAINLWSWYEWLVTIVALLMPVFIVLVTRILRRRRDATPQTSIASPSEPVPEPMEHWRWVLWGSFAISIPPLVMLLVGPMLAGSVLLICVICVPALFIFLFHMGASRVMHGQSAGLLSTVAAWLMILFVTFILSAFGTATALSGLCFLDSYSDLLLIMMMGLRRDFLMMSRFVG